MADPGLFTFPFIFHLSPLPEYLFHPSPSFFFSNLYIIRQNVQLVQVFQRVQAHPGAYLECGHYGHGTAPQRRGHVFQQRRRPAACMLSDYYLLRSQLIDPLEPRMHEDGTSRWR